MFSHHHVLVQTVTHLLDGISSNDAISHVININSCFTMTYWIGLLLNGWRFCAIYTLSFKKKTQNQRTIEFKSGELGGDDTVHCLPMNWLPKFWLPKLDSKCVEWRWSIMYHAIPKHIEGTLRTVRSWWATIRGLLTDAL